MSLRLMLDENLSYVIAEQIHTKRPDILVSSLHTWRGGTLLGQSDEEIIHALHEEGWLFVTTDTQILAEQFFLYDGSADYSGILFIDDKTLAFNDFGGICRALIAFSDHNSEQNWRNRIGFLSKSENE